MGMTKKERVDLYINLKGKDFVLWSGLLAEAHKKGIQSLSTDIVQLPTPENEMTCIVQATVKLESGAVFSDIGDANPRNCGKMIVPHLIRMASTRAKARCLRDAVNIGVCSLDELGGDDTPQNIKDKTRQTPVEGAKKSNKGGSKGQAKKDAPAAYDTEETKSILWTMFSDLMRSSGHKPTDEALNKKSQSDFGCEWRDMTKDQMLDMIDRIENALNA